MTLYIFKCASKEEISTTIEHFFLGESKNLFYLDKNNYFPHYNSS